VYAGQDRQVTLPADEAKIDLAGAVTGAVPARCEWAFVGQQGLAQFGNPMSLSTWTQFVQPGVYQLALLAKDNQDAVLGADALKVTVKSAAEQQLIVYAGSDRQINLPVDSAIVCGGITGGGWTTAEWVFAEPAATVTFNEISELDKWVEFSSEGIYRLGLLAKNGTQEIIGVDTVEITFDDPCTAGDLPLYGQAVNITAGSETSVTLPASLSLTADITGDWDSIKWIQPTLDNRVHFVPEGSVSTTATFDEAGSYNLGIVVKYNDTFVGADTIAVTVNPVDEHRLSVDVTGDNDEIALPDDTVNLTGSIEQGYDSFEWIDPTSSMVTFTPADSLTPDARFADAGKYALSLLARDTDGSVIGRDSTIITVSDGTLVVDAGIDQTHIVPVENLPLEISMKGTVTGLKAGQDINWELMDGPEDMITINDTNEPRTTVTIKQFTVYVLQLQVKEGDNVLGHNNVRITVFPENLGPDVYAGRDRKGELSGGQEQIQIDDAWIWEFFNYNPDYIEPFWEQVAGPAGVSFDETGIYYPTVTFTESGIYELKLTAKLKSTDEPLGDDTVLVTIFDEGQALIVDAGDPKTVEMDGSNQAYLYLDDARVVIRAAGEVTLTWSVVSGPDVPNIITDSPGTPMNPMVVFDKTGTYVLKLEAGQQGWPNVSDEAVINVVPPGASSDETAPTISLSLTHNGELVSGAVSGLIDVEVTAADEGWGIAALELRWDNENGEVLRQISGAPAYPDIAQLNYTINTYYLINTTYTLYARVTDAAGNVRDATETFSSTGPSSTEPPTAAITNPVFFKDAKCQVPQEAPLAVLDEGKFFLKGSAYHTGGDVEYRVDLFRPQIKALDTRQWNKPNYALHQECFVKTLFPDDGNDWQTASILNDNLGMLDFSGVENGSYVLLLTVKNQGTSKSYAQVGFLLDCPLKIGQVKFSQEDLAIKVGGVFLSVVRTYDSLKKDKNGEFGYGWTYSVANMDIELDEERNEGIVLLDSAEYVVERSLRCGSNYNRNVTLTLPDGQRATFVFYLDCCDEYFGCPVYKAAYASPPGVSAGLVTQDDELINPFTGIWDKQGIGMFGEGVRDPANYDFSGYKLTMADGTTYYFDREKFSGGGETGNLYWCDDNPFYAVIYGEPYLSRIETASGEKIKFNVDMLTGDIGAAGDKGIEHYDSQGNLTKAIKIDYDFAGRISEIWAPSEQGTGWPTIIYEYDGYGNLTEVHKLVDKTAPSVLYEVTKYEYDVPSNHYVTGIEDSRGLTPVRYVYEDGRLVRTIDARGNVIELEHDNADAAGKFEFVTDRSGNSTAYYYNDRGNIVRLRKYLDNPAEYEETLYEYDDQPSGKPGQGYYDPGNPDRPTKVKVALVQNPSGDDDYSITQYIYENHPVDDEDFGHLERQVVIDPEDNVTDTWFDTKGNVTETIQGILDTLEPLAYTEVTRTENEYYYRTPGGTLTTLPETSDTLTNLLAWTKVYTDINTNQYEKTEYTYDSKNCITEVQKINYDVVPAEPVVVTIYGYDQAQSNSPDQPYSITDAAGFVRYFQYDDNGNQILSWYEWDDPDTTGVDPDLYVFNVTEYDDEGRVIETRRLVDDENPYNPAYLVSEVVLSQTVYNSIGKVDYSIDENGVLTKYEYDELGSLVETKTYKNLTAYQADPVANILTITQTLYDLEGRVLVSVDTHEPGQTAGGTENVYDALGRVIETHRWEDVEINLVDLVVEGVKVGRKVPDGVEPEDAWTSDGAAPVAGDEMTYSRSEYDIAGRLELSVSLDEDGYEQPTSYEYDLAGKQTAVIDPLGHDITYIADGSWHVIDSFSLNGTHRTETEYEGVRRKLIRDALNNETQFTYDAISRVIATCYPDADLDGDGQINDPSYSYIGYDSLGRKSWQSAQTRQTDRDHTDSWAEDRDYRLRKRNFSYDAAGRLIQVELPEPQDGAGVPLYDYIYDEGGNIVGILDPLNRLTVFKYDHLNNLTAKYMPFVPTTPPPADIDTAQEVYTALSNASPTPKSENRVYDKLGRLRKVVDYKGQAVIYKYNSRGLLEYKDFYQTDPSPGTKPGEAGFDPGTADSSIDYTYDDLGREVTATITEYSGGSPSYKRCYAKLYDTEGQIESVKIYPSYADYEAGTNLIDSVGYGYDATIGQKSHTCSPAAGTVAGADTWINYQYDELGRLENVVVDKRNSQSVTETTNYTYNAVGSRGTLEYANANFTEYSYDAVNRLTELTNWATSAKSTQLSKWKYQLGADGRRKSAQESMSENRAITYTYDDLNRLTGENAEETDSGNAYGYEATYSYDLAGNRAGRTIIVDNTSGSETITTSYTYYTSTDKLHTESDTVTSASILNPNRRIYACVSDGRVSYSDAVTGRLIGPLMAFLIGLPMVWSRYAFIIAMIMLLVLKQAYTVCLSMDAKVDFFGVTNPC